MDELARLRTVLDLLAPMHAVLDARGQVCGAGATLRKICPGLATPGARFLDHFNVLRPQGLDDVAALRAAAGQRLRLQTRLHPRIGLKGVLAPWGAGSVINMSFGIAILDAVKQYDLTNTDFAITDMTIEMLYLFEAKSAAMEASRKLNHRLQGAKAVAEQQAVTDALTGLGNRRAMHDGLQRMVEAGGRFALVQIDLDFFKEVNDTLGHAAGDHVLRHVARVLTQETRRNDLVARVGGDEFVIILPDMTDVETLERIAARIIAQLEEPLEFEGETCRISASIGISLSDHYRHVNPDQMIADADAALYASKRAGRARHTVHRPAPI